MGHIFKLGDKYSQPMEAEFLDSNGKNQPFVMGCYGIGVTRLLSAILEQKADDKGCVWGNVAPFKLDIIVSNIKNLEQMVLGEKIYATCVNLGFDVILDDRNERFGRKINDFELIGFEYALIIGKKLQDKKVELIKREGLEKQELDSHKIIEILENILI